MSDCLSWRRCGSSMQMEVLPPRNPTHITGDWEQHLRRTTLSSVSGLSREKRSLPQSIWIS